MTHELHDRRPSLLVDVDGVLNVWPGPKRPGHRWRTHLVRSASDIEYRVHVNPSHGEMLMALADLYELTWCTTWWPVANKRIAPLLGLPENMPCVPLPPTWTAVPVAFSAKSAYVRRYASGRPIAWVDDDVDERDTQALTRVISPTDTSALAGTQPCSAALALNADPDVGLTTEHAARLREWAQALPAGPDH